MTANSDTYASLLTPSGAGAIGVIRVTGPAAFSAIAALFQSRHAQSLTIEHFFNGQLRYGHLVDKGEILDDVLIAPVSESPTPAFDITAHGGVRVLERILAALEARGAPFRAANSSNATFTSPNFIAHEALTTLRRARTSRAVSFLAHQRTLLPRALTNIRKQLSANPAAARSTFSDLLARATAALNLIHGVTIVLVGPPNSGKSTLFNRLVGRSAAIVSPRPGTTRDWITAELDIAGLPVTLIDTAGIREETDALEREAIARGRQIAHAAAMSLLILDAAELPHLATLTHFTSGHQVDAIVLNKTDLLSENMQAPLSPSSKDATTPTLAISAATGHNLTALTIFILHSAGLDLESDPPLPAFFTHRQVQIATSLLALPVDQFATAAADSLTSMFTPSAGLAL